MNARHSFTFDGFGINDANDPFKARVATLSPVYCRKQVGNLLAAAPDLLRALELMRDAWDAPEKTDAQRSKRSKAWMASTAAITKAKLNN